ncbi:MAG: polysaccharide deacetylase family protein [Oceanipulchritudo sp.]
MHAKPPFGTARGAVSLTYDDSMDCHLDLVAPALEAHGFRGTFYTPVNAGLLNRMDEWGKLAANGHELGNHTLHHPCRGRPDASWIKPERDLRHYTPERWEMEVALANLILDKIEGRGGRSYGNTCHNNTVGPDEAQVSLDPHMLKHFVAARGNCHGPDYSIVPATADLSNLGTLSGDNMTLEQWLAAVDRAVNLGHWVIFTFHGVGAEKKRLQVPEADHTALLKHMAAYGEKLWVAPVREVATAISERSR